MLQGISRAFFHAGTDETSCAFGYVAVRLRDFMAIYWFTNAAWVGDIRVGNNQSRAESAELKGNSFIMLHYSFYQL